MNVVSRMDFALVVQCTQEDLVCVLNITELSESIKAGLESA